MTCMYASNARKDFFQLLKRVSEGEQITVHSNNNDDVIMISKEDFEIYDLNMDLIKNPQNYRKIIEGFKSKPEDCLAAEELGVFDDV